MAEPLIEPPPPATFHDPTEAEERALARKNMMWGWTLFGLFWLLFAGTIGVAYIWIWIS